MSETPNLKLPFVAAAQAQKHVTVNEALARVDAALQMSVVSRTTPIPPALVAGEVYLVPDNPTGDWVGHVGVLAFAVGQGWEFIPPQSGWRIWVSDEAKWIFYDGAEWMDGTLATSVSGAGFRADVVEVDVTINAASNSIVTAAVIPEGSVVFAITGRVINGFDGTLSDWALGVSGADDRYGSGLGTAGGAFVRGLTGQPQSYYADTPLTITANGGDFGTGSARLAIHLMQFELPRV